MSAEKTIDGLTTKRATASRATEMKTVKPKPSAVSIFKKKAKPAPQGEPGDPLKAKAKENRAELAAAKDISVKKVSKKQAHADFLKPVETFDFDITSEDLKADKKSLKQQKKAAKQHKNAADKPKKDKKKPSKLRIILTTFLLLIVLTIIGGVVWVLVWGNDIIAKLTGNNSDIWSAISAFTSETYVDLKTDTNGRTNILVFGTSGYDMSGSVGKKHHAGSQLTDSIMAIGIDQTNGDIVMTSLPRDLKVAGACYAGKINEVYLCNNKNGKDDKAGAEGLMKAVSDVLGIQFQYYAHINWGSLIQIVDALGGITITLDENINDKGYTGAVYKAGVPYHINGEAALGLARARHGTPGGDFSRGTSQQKILIGIKDKITEKMENGNFDLGTAVSLVSALGDNLRTNISIEEIKTGVHLVKDLDFNQMRQVMLYNYKNYSQSLMKTANINGISYVIPTAGAGNYSKVHALIAKEFSTNAVEREAAKILILNGTNVSGLAATEGKALEAEGYKVAELGNAPAGEYPERYTLYLMKTTASGTAQALRGSLNAEIRPAAELPEGINASKYDLVLILGGNRNG